MSVDVIAGTVPGPSETPAGLFSPPESNKALNIDDESDSELSDIDENGARLEKNAVVPPAASSVEEQPDEVKIEDVRMEEGDHLEDDIGEITPDYFDKEGNVPVFKPTMFQFKDFEVYVSLCFSHEEESGRGSNGW
jgi:hypothetical protein